MSEWAIFITRYYLSCADRGADTAYSSRIDGLLTPSEMGDAP